MAYTKELPKPRCAACGGRAAVAVFNHYNSHLGDFCRRCGAAKVKAIEWEQLKERTKKKASA